MSYKGLVALVQLGQGGMLTDDSPTMIPTTNLINCRNCVINNGSISNEPGSVRWNKVQTAYTNSSGVTVTDGSGIVAVYDWFPVQDIQYTIIVTRIGKVYRFLNPYSFVEITANKTADSNLETAPDFLSITDSVKIIEGGQESAGLPRKLFIFTGGSQVQVISGTNAYRTNIARPPVDWKAGNYPISGINFINRIFAFGNPNFPHNVYASGNLFTGGALGNEDYTSNPFNVNVTNIEPGFSQKVIAAFNYKGRLQVAKYPRGLYYLNLPNQADPTSWYYSKLSDDIGTTSPSASCNVYDDYWMMNNVNSITSMSAALTLGQMTTADVLKQAKVSNFFANIISPLGIGVRQAIFNTQTKKAYFLTRKTSFDVAQRQTVFEGTNQPSITQLLSENVNSLMIVFDFSSENQKIMYSDKDQANCLALIKNNIGVDELYFGSEDGYLYKHGQSNKAIRYDYPIGQISLAVSGVSGSIPSGTYQYGLTNLIAPSSPQYAVTFASGASVLNFGSGSLASGNVVYFSGNGTLASPLTGGTQPYYVLGVTGVSAAVSLTPSGSAVTFTSSGSGTMRSYVSGVSFQESAIGAISIDLLSNPVPSNSSGYFTSGTQVGSVSITNPAASGRINLTNIPTSYYPNVVARNLYRSSGSNVSSFAKLTTLNDNFTTTYLDNNASASGAAPTVGTDATSVAYTAEFQTPHMDFTQTDLMSQSVRRIDKNFDFLEIEYLPTGASNVSVDVYIDGVYSQTKSFYLGKGPQLDVMQLDYVRLQGGSVRSNRLAIGRRGRTISFRVYANVLERSFNISALRVYFRMQGEANKA